MNKKSVLQPNCETITKPTDTDYPLVSVVTVVFNGEEFLEKTIRSVASQSYNNIEYIVIDGGSSDRTLAIIREYETEIDYWVSEPDGGIYEAMNKGISLCKGELIKLLNADDLLTESSVQKAVSFYKENRTSPRFIINSFLEVIDSGGAVVKTWTDKNWGKKYPAFLHPSWYVPASIYSELGLYDARYRIASDYEFYLRLKKYGVKIVTKSNPLARYRMHGASSGYRGIVETYKINVVYFGHISAIYDFLLRAATKSLGKLRFLLRRSK